MPQLPAGRVSVEKQNVRKMNIVAEPKPSSDSAGSVSLCEMHARADCMPVPWACRQHTFAHTHLHTHTPLSRSRALSLSRKHTRTHTSTYTCKHVSAYSAWQAEHHTNTHTHTHTHTNTPSYSALRAGVPPGNTDFDSYIHTNTCIQRLARRSDAEE